MTKTRGCRTSCAQEIIVEPQESIVSLAGGQSTSREITLSNTTDKSVTIEANLQNLVYQSGDENVAGLIVWTTIEPSRVVIPSNSQVAIHYRIDIPEGITGPHWAVIVFREIIQTVDGEEAYRQLVSTCMIGQEDPTNLVCGALITGIGLTQVSETEQYFVVQVLKTGTGFNKYTGEIAIVSQSRGLLDPVAVLPIPEFGVLPLQTGQIFILYNDEFLPDIYQIVVTVFLGEDLAVSGIWAFKKRE